MRQPTAQRKRPVLRASLPHEPPRGAWAVTLRRDYARGSEVAPHLHGSDQLIYATQGVMQVSAGQRLWTIPPYFALWVPAQTVHGIRMPEAVSMRSIYLRRVAAAVPDSCRVLHVRPLLRELIVAIVNCGELRTHQPVHRALRTLLIAELSIAALVASTVLLPKDARAAAIARQFVSNPGLRSSLRDLCDGAGLSVRTLERLFRKETGLDFETWRRQVRLMRALEMLAAGMPVKAIAPSVGYRQPSAFVAAFRSIHGESPKKWISVHMNKPGNREN